jgi:hypothetical protein
MEMKTIDVWDLLTDRERETITDLLMEAYVRETNESPWLFEVQTNIIVEAD